MSKITKIEPQVKNKDRVNIYLDGEFKLGCSLELAMLNHLKNDVEISDEQLEQLVFENEKTQALNKAVTLLGKNLKTRRQMRTYLNDKGYSKTIVDYVLEKLSEYNYINDINYAKIYIRSVKNKYGKVKIIANLRQKGVSDKDIDEVMQEFESDTDSIMALAQKYMKNKEVNQDNIAKLYRHLLSKGFGYDEVNSVVREIKEKLC
mgnify:FL=1